MVNSRIVKYILFLGLTLILVACSSADDTTTSDAAENEESDKEQVLGGELTVAYAAQPNTLDPHMTQERGVADMMRNVFETLITVDADYNVQPMLADSYEQSDDGKTYTFHLREGVHFHNGDELKAEDVVASMNRWFNEIGSRGQFNDASFKEIDDFTVVLELEEPLSTTLTALSFGGQGFAAIMPKEVIENAEASGVEEFIGTGPYQLNEWEVDQQVHLEKFDDYQGREEPADGLSGKREALIDDLYFQFVSDPSTRIAGILTEEYDVIHSVPYDDIEQLDNEENVETNVYPGGYFGLQFNKKNGLFTDQRAREAVATGLNMEDVLIGAYADDRYYMMDHNMMMDHQQTQWSSDAGKDKYNVNDPEKAKEILDELGYDGEEITLLTTRDHETQYNGSVVIKDQLESLGMNINLEIIDWATLLDRIRDEEDDYDFFVMENATSYDPVTNGFMNKNSPGWTNSKELDKLAKEFRRKPTLEEAQDMFDDIQAWYWDYIPMIQVGEYKSASAVRDTVNNLQYQDGYIFWNTTIDE